MSTVSLIDIVHDSRLVRYPLSPSRPSLIQRVNHFFSDVGEFVQEWTPFLIVLSYFIFSTCLYMICSQKWMQAFWFTYLATNTYIATATVIEALESIGPEKEARKAIANVATKGWKFPTPDSEVLILDLIIVAYLPNEKDIIMGRIHYALTKIVYPVDKIRINVVYNTPRSIEPLESEMYALTQEYPQLRVIKVPNSTSKAHNLNYFCTLDTGADVIAIFDCDHYTHPYSPRWAVERFIADKTIETVQGRCVVQNASDNFMTAMIAVEFDKIYAVSHPGRAAMFDFGLFCGSNGYWKASLLRELKMDGSMLCEDIDSALRAFARGAKVVQDLNVVSYELAPTTPSAFWKQRLRWAQGWAQASMRHMPLSWSKTEEGRPKRSFKQRFGMASLLYVRESSYYLVTQYLCLVFSVVITEWPHNGAQLVKLVFFQYPVAYWLFFMRFVLSRTCAES
jgi:cellulose synthase/poly-beta-1,6-N-acetylglucosamine synthase-like glycosyltransferase